MTQGLSEQAILFGKNASLVGIFTRPINPPDTTKPTLVILNTGIIHRVGHHRMFVTMSRVLAAAGYSVLRFDFSGIGDSDPRGGSLSTVEAAMADIRDALDWVEQSSRATRFILLGLCSGADYAVFYGHTDDRIAGLILLDPSIPQTLRYYVHFLAPRLKRLHSWIDLITGRSRTLRMWVNYLLGAHLRLPGRASRLATEMNLIDRGRVERYYQSTVDKGINILAVFTQESTRQTYREQMVEALRNVNFGESLDLEYFAGSDHLFIGLSDRCRLTRIILDWLSARTVVHALDSDGRTNGRKPAA